MATGRKERHAKGGESRFYCEVCGRQVPPEDENCPYCGTPFYAVKCPRCGYTDKAMSFVSGCPSCGYLSPEQRKEAEKKQRDSHGPRRRSRSAGEASRSKSVSPHELMEEREKRRSGDLFTTFLLIFLLLALAGLMVLYIVM